MPRDGTYAKPNTEAAALLRKAKALIDTPEKWCQGTEAQDKNGRGVFCDSSAAVQFCALGALGNLGSCSGYIVSDFLDKAARKMGHYGTDNESPAANLNDTTDHPTVMAMFDLAIRLANAEAA